MSVSASYMSRIECGKNHASLELLVNICEVLGTKLAEVMTGNQGNFPKEYLIEFTQIMNGCTADDKSHQATTTVEQLLDEVENLAV